MKESSTAWMGERVSSCYLEVNIKKQLKCFLLNVNFKAGAGCLGILGPSGCGKSMTLKSIAGIETPDSGKIQFQIGRTQEHINLLYDSEKCVNLVPQKRRVGYLFQNYALFPNMTVEQNIAAGLRGKSNVKKIIADMTARFRLQGLEKQYPARLSGGQQQRVALARIMAYDPDVMLLDEPFSAMDTYLRERLRLELSEVLRDYKGISVMVTHDRDEAYQLCDHVLLLDEGRVITAGKTKDVFDNPVTVQAARLTGCKNISRIERLGNYRVRALDWCGLELITTEKVEDCITHIGIRAHNFEPVNGEQAVFFKLREDGNLIPVIDPQISEMPFEWYITLKNGLWWKIAKTGADSQAMVPAYLRIKPTAILLLKE